MKKLISHISFLAIWLSTIHVVRAQGTVYVSNLGQTPTGSMAVGSDSWIAQGFSPAFDANQPSQYVLNSVQLLMDPMSGSPADFTVSLYSSYAGAPQNDLGTLSGPNPSTAGIFTYTASDIPLSESSYYFIVVTAASPIAQSAYVWSAANGVTVGSDNWYIDDTYYKSASGLSWTRNNRGDVFQMSISATAVPEPETCALLGSGLACVLFWPRRLNR